MDGKMKAAEREEKESSASLTLPGVCLARDRLSRPAGDGPRWQQGDDRDVYVAHLNLRIRGPRLGSHVFPGWPYSDRAEAGAAYHVVRDRR